MNLSKFSSENLYFGIFRMVTFSMVLVFVGIILILLINAGPALNLHFLTADWVQSDITKGGIYPAIVGSFYIGIGVALISLPLGIGTAIYLTEYSSGNLTKRIIQLAIRNLAGVPSIIYGLFGLAFFARTLALGTSLIAATLTLSIMTLPWIISASVEALNAVPHSFREASLALGATKWQTIKNIILPRALPGCLTGSIIGIARTMGETAPIILVGATFFLSRLPGSIYDKFMALPYHIFILATQHPSPNAPQYASATAVVLIGLIILINLGAILARYYFKKHEA
jgi:phosphate transport system permease protein